MAGGHFKTLRMQQGHAEQVAMFYFQARDISTSSWVDLERKALDEACDVETDNGRC